MEERAAKDGAIAIECPAGSVAVWDGSLWHGNWPRTLPGERVVLHVAYTRLMMRPMESYPPAVEEALIAAHGEDMAQLLGRHDFLGKPAGKGDIRGSTTQSRIAGPDAPLAGSARPSTVSTRRLVGRQSITSQPSGR